MSRLPFILLPPSESKALGGAARGRTSALSGLLADQRESLVASLAALSGDRAAVERLTRVRGALLERASDSIERLVAGDAALLATWRRYTGVVWTHLEPSTLTPSQRRRILVPSALYGVTAGEDPIADYRLTFHATVAGCGPLGAFWRDPVTDAVRAVAGHSPIVDLLPAEHRRALDLERLAGATRLIAVRFQTADGNRAIGHAAKAVKGVLARRLLVDGLAALDSFEWGPWRGAVLDDRVAVIRAYGV